MAAPAEVDAREAGAEPVRAVQRAERAVREGALVQAQLAQGWERAQDRHEGLRGEIDVVQLEELERDRPAGRGGCEYRVGGVGLGVRLDEGRGGGALEEPEEAWGDGLLAVAHVFERAEV